MLPIKCLRSLKSEISYYLVFRTNAFQFSRERRIGFTDKYTENQNLNLRLFL